MGDVKLKAVIAPHGNEDYIKDTLFRDGTMCPPTGIRPRKSIASLFGGIVSDADVETAFLQKGKAERDVSVKPPSKRKMRSMHLWLLLVAFYGIFNSNANWQKKI